MANLNITKPKRDPNRLTYPERGLLGYMQENRSRNGYFQQSYEKTADAGLSTPSTVRRWTNSLIYKGAVIVVVPSSKNSRGFNIPAILGIPPQSIDQICPNYKNGVG